MVIVMRQSAGILRVDTLIWSGRCLDTFVRDPILSIDCTQA
jgi:hypothetical protein